MATTQETFAKQILKIPGIKNYILIKNDGLILAHNVEIDFSEILSSIVVFCGFTCNLIKNEMGFSRFNYLKLNPKNNEILLIFPIKHFFLGIVQQPDANTAKLIENVKQFTNKMVYNK